MSKMDFWIFIFESDQAQCGENSAWRDPETGKKLVNGAHKMITTHSYMIIKCHKLFSCAHFPNAPINPDSENA